MTKTEIANLTLFCLGASKQLANVDTDMTVEARTIRACIDGQRDFCMRELDWPLATAYSVPGLVAGTSSTPAVPDWFFSYRQPADCLKVRRVMTAGLSSFPITFGRHRKFTIPPIAFTVGRDSQGALIYTNLQNANIEYTIRITDYTALDPMFATMLAWRIAIVCAPALSRVDGITKTVQNGYELEKQRATAAAFNEGDHGLAPDAEWHQGR
jgi:hypothetical protein